MNCGTLLLGCALALGSVTAAKAGDAYSQDTVGAQHSSVDSASPRDAGGSGSDTGPTHEAPVQVVPASSASSSDSPRQNNGNPTRARHVNLGWQSLLPGSIQ